MNARRISMFARDAMKLRHLIGASLAALLVLGASACDPGVTPPSTKIRVAARVPPTDDNPLATVDASFIAMVADFAGNTGKFFDVQRYQPGVQIKVPAVPFGPARQLRVEVYQGEDQPTVAYARGATIPVDMYATSPGVELHPYVTRINAFAGVFGEPDETGSLPQTSLPGPVAGTTLTALPTGQVLATGGAAPKGSAKNPFDPASYGAPMQDVALYDPDARNLSYAEADAGKLATGRAFHTAALGQTVVALVGGVEAGTDGKPRASDKIEFYNIATGEVTTPTQTEPNLHFGRIGPTVIQMFEKQDYFLVLGGKGNEDCPADPHQGLCAGNTWEIWHATGGFKAMGQLSTARWHHAGVRVPGPDGGFVMLVGGENTQGAVRTLEVVQYTVSSGNVLVSDALTNCPADCPAKPAGFLWNPVSYDNQPVRIWPQALFVANNALQYYHVYFIGGFADVDHKSANKSVDVFDIVASQVIATKNMSFGRAGAAVAAVTAGPSTGQVLIAGGSNTDTQHWANGDFLHVESDGQGNLNIDITPIDNAMGDGERTLGAAAGLSTGHVLLLGGTGGNATSLSGRTDAIVWNPY